MALTIPGLDEIVRDTTAFYRNRFRGRDVGTESFLGKAAYALAMSVLGIQKSALVIDRDSVPSDRSSSRALEDWAFAFGVPWNAGGFGRNQPTLATCGKGFCRGNHGIIFPDGVLLVAEDGKTRVALSGAVTIPGQGPGTDQALGSFVAVVPGP